jgi:acylphosphatase
VQGVGFRAWVERTAVGLSLDGWVRNRRDGGVELVVAGPAGVIDHMIDLCRRGSPAARVDAVKVLDEPDSVAAGFTVLPTI